MRVFLSKGVLLLWNRSGVDWGMRAEVDEHEDERQGNHQYDS